MEYKLIHNDCIKAMKEMSDHSIDSIVTDPPYELGFMGKSWDSSGIAFNVEVWQEALRVLKPGGHLIAFSGSRTYHRMAVAIEDAGFEIRDQIMWIYGSGFPKSMDISKAIDKAAGAEREVLGVLPSSRAKASDSGFMMAEKLATAPATDAAKQWQGWGTALKPAHEPMVLARKPLIGTVANNVLTYGTGGLNIDGGRVGFADDETDNRVGTDFVSNGGDASNNANDNQVPNKHYVQMYKAEGRFPANLIHDGSDEVVGSFPTTKSGDWKGQNKGVAFDGNENGQPYFWQGDSGSAARFFYCAKTSKRDRNEGLDEFEAKQTTGGGGLTAELREDGSYETASAGGKYGSVKAKQQNTHPTVKPTDLMQYLCRLVTPPNGTVLDPFMGSGSTGKACMYEKFNFIGIDMTEEYINIARARIEFAKNQAVEEEQGTLF